MDVYAFGHVLYEMTFGRPLLEATCSELPHCDSSLKNLLDVILSPEALKQDLPTVMHLMEHPFFENAKKTYRANASAIEKPHFKLSSHLKDALLEASNKAELRLRDEQKVARHQKRLVKVQEMMSSEEEMKKRKQKLVREEFNWILIWISLIYYYLCELFFSEKGAEASPRTTFFKSIGN